METNNSEELETNDIIQEEVVNETETPKEEVESEENKIWHADIPRDENNCFWRKYDFSNDGEVQRFYDETGDKAGLLGFKFAYNDPNESMDFSTCAYYSDQGALLMSFDVVDGVSKQPVISRKNSRGYDNESLVESYIKEVERLSDEGMVSSNNLDDTDKKSIVI